MAYLLQWRIGPHSEPDRVGDESVRSERDSPPTQDRKSGRGPPSLVLWEMPPHTSWATAFQMLLALLVQAKSVEEQLSHAIVNHSVVDVASVAPCFENSKIHKPSELIGNRLGLHVHSRSQGPHARIAQQDQGVQESEPCVRSQHFKYPG